MSQITKFKKIPMLNVYSDLFNPAHPRSPIGRKGRLFIEVCRANTITRKQLSADLNIRPGTVSDSILELINQGLISEKRPDAPYEKGRPEILLVPVKSRLAAIVYFVVSQSIHAVLVDFSGDVLGRTTTSVQADQIGNTGLLDLFIDMAHELQSQKPHETEIVGASFSLPGIVDETKCRWMFASRWPVVRDMSFDRISEELGFRVVVNRNLNCELRARIDRREEQLSGNILFIHWGYGIGASYALNGNQILTGDGGFGEIGHMIVNLGDERLCRCGMKGCLETHAALWALLPRLREKYPDVPADEWNFEKYLNEQMNFDLDLFSDAIQLMATAMRNLALTLYPQQIILSGPFVQHPKIFENLNSAFNKLLPVKSHVNAHHRVTLGVGRAGSEDEIIGAACPVFEQALKTLCK